EIPKQAAGTKLSVTASNSAGTSKVTEVTVQATETISEAPEVNEVKDTDEKVTGRSVPDSRIVVLKLDALDEQGYLLFHGDTDRNGDFSISIPRQKAGTELLVARIFNDGSWDAERQVTVTVKETVPSAPKVSEVKDTD
ncbi:Ig-like domain-containing protein, partial [Bacillus thuringiensis]|nr:Ig-like domain-containing protein [Bacillus thuringiensis]